MGGWFEVGLNAVFPYVALDTGLTSDFAVMLVGVLATGALVSQLPVFLFADRVASNSSIRACSAVLFLGALALGTAPIAPNLFWLSAALFGSGGGALYTLAMIEVALSRDGQSVATLTTAAVSAYTLGAAVGPLGAGFLLDNIGSNALWIVFALLPVALLLLTFNRFSPLKKEN